MKKIGDTALKQTELNRRYYDAHELVLFSARIEKELFDKLKTKLKRQGKSIRQFVTEVIEEYLGR